MRLSRLDSDMAFQRSSMPGALASAVASFAKCAVSGQLVLRTAFQLKVMPGNQNLAGLLVDLRLFETQEL